MGIVSEENGGSRSTVLVLHIIDNQVDFFIEALRKSESEWTWTIYSWVKETGSARSQGPRMRYDTKLWLCCRRAEFNPKFNYDTNEDVDR